MATVVAALTARLWRSTVCSEVTPELQSYSTARPIRGCGREALSGSDNSIVTTLTEAGMRPALDRASVTVVISAADSGSSG